MTLPWSSQRVVLQVRALPPVPRLRIWIGRSVLIAMVAVHSFPVVGQQVPEAPARPLYPLPRYNEDWGFLSDSSKRNDFWDPLKYVPFSSNEEIYLSFGGEMRGTYDRFHNTNFDLSPQDPDGYFLQRYLLHVDLHGGSRFRFFGELNMSLENGRTGGPRPVIDEDKLDVHQGFFDILLARPTDSSSLSFRVGRQEIAFGSGRLVALREGTNVPLSFDGARITVHASTWQVDGFATRPVQATPGNFDDVPLHDFAFWGVYGTRLLPGPGKPALDIYYLGVDHKRPIYNQGAAHEVRHTLGVRLCGQHGRWSYDDEVMYQFGQFGSGSIDAWRAAADHAYTFSTARWHPRLALAADIASGDHTPAIPNLQTFNALFQSGTYSGRAGILGPDNAIRLEPSLGLLFSEHLTLSGGWGFYWRESTNDGLFGIAGNLIVPSNGVKSRYEGSRPIAQLDWQVTRHLSTHLNYIYVFNARFEEQSVHGTHSMSYVSPWITYRF
jgi:Alginate export